MPTLVWIERGVAAVPPAGGDKGQLWDSKNPPPLGEFKVGDRILFNFRDQRRNYYPGTVEAICEPPQRVRVAFDDGDTREVDLRLDRKGYQDCRVCREAYGVPDGFVLKESPCTAAKRAAAASAKASASLPAEAAVPTKPAAPQRQPSRVRRSSIKGFGSGDPAEHAMEELDGHELQGLALAVTRARGPAVSLEDHRAAIAAAIAASCDAAPASLSAGHFIGAIGAQYRVPGI